MSIPKYTNPFGTYTSSIYAIEITSRSDVFGDSSHTRSNWTADLHPDTLGSEKGVLERKRKWLENYVKETLDMDGVCELEASSDKKKKKRYFEPEMGNNEDKREKEEGKFEFRLISSSAQPGMMYITEKPYSVDRLRERLRYEYEDDTLKAAERKKRAETVAVNLEWVMAQGKMAYPNLSNVAERTNPQSLHAISLIPPLTDSRILHVVIDKSSITRQNDSRIYTCVKEKEKNASCPTISFHISKDYARNGATRRRHHRAKPRSKRLRNSTLY